MKTEKMRRAILVMCLALVSCELGFGETPRYRIIDLGTLDCYGRVWAINDNGQIAGGYVPGGIMHAVVWDPVYGKIDLGHLGSGGGSRANYINNSGYAVGGAWAGDDNHAFIWDDVNGMVDLGTLYFNDLYFSEAFCINDAGQVVGGSYTEQGSRAFLWDSVNGMVNLGTLGGSSGAYGINNSGQVVGYTGSPNHAFLWDSTNGMIDLGTLGGDSSDSQAINNAGQVVGYADTTVVSENHAFLCDSTNGMIDLSELALEDAGFTQITYATGINNQGQIVGYGEISGEVHAFVMTPATIWHVDGVTGDNGNDGLSRETAFATIQKGVDVANDLDTVLVWPGVYVESVYFIDKAITVKAAADAPILEAGSNNAVSFYTSEGQETVLSNFVIRDSDTGIFVSTGTPTIRNITLAGNGLGIEAENGAVPDIRNCIFFNNTNGDLWNCTAQYSCIEETGAGEGNISSDPLFVDANSGDYHLLSERGRYRATTDEWILDEVSSPCIDGGEPNVWPLEEAMPNGGRINMGAYGGTGTASMSEWSLEADFDYDGSVANGDIGILSDDWLEELTFSEETTGSALQFDGVDDYVEIAYDASLDFQGGNITVAGWFNLIGYYEDTGLVTDKDDDHHTQFELSIGRMDLPWPYSYYPAFGFCDMYWRTAVASQQYTGWHHIAGTYDGNTLKIYVDGMEEGSTFDITGLPDDYDSAKYIGRSHNTSGLQPYFGGIIDEVAIYDRALGASEIEDIYHCGVIADANLVGYWDFEEGEGQVAADSSGNGNDGQLGSDPNADSADPAWAASEVPGAIWHVDGASGDNENDGLTRETAFATIQKGVSSAEDCDTVVVWPGAYSGPVYIVDKAIVVKSADEAAVIDGGFDDAVVFYSWEGKEAVLKNFVIKNGFAGVYVYNGQPELANLTIVDCYTGIEAETGAEPNIVSTILWYNDYDLWNCTAQYSCIEETGAGEGNISADPLFADANNGDYHLLSERGRYRESTDEWILDEVSSPAIDGGDPYASLGAERSPNGGRINMGAYGGTTQASRSEWPFAGDLNLDGIVNLADFAILAEDWLEGLPWAE